MYFLATNLFGLDERGGAILRNLSPIRWAAEHVHTRNIFGFRRPGTIRDVGGRSRCKGRT